MYLPFVKSSDRIAMGLKPLPLQNWIEIDDAFTAELTLKSALLAHCYQDVFAALPHTQAAQQEALHLLIDHLLQHFPLIYQAQKKGTSSGIDNLKIDNLKTAQSWNLEDFSQAPLDLAARLVQEDLCLMLPDLMLPNKGYRLAAASVCFPLRWSLKEKLGQPLSQIHQRVPDYPQRLTRHVDNMFDRLKENSPALRFNWSLVDSPELHLAQNKQITQFNPAISADNAGASLWLRVEKQTLRRLPISRGILFTIRTFVYPLEKVTERPTVAAELAKAVQSLKLEMQIYKNLLPFRQALMSYLDSRIERRVEAIAPP